MFQIFEGLEKRNTSRGDMTARTLIASLAALLALGLGSVLTTAVAHAAPNGGTVKGSVALAGAPKHPVRSEGFVKRKPNPICEVKPYDPRQYVVVVLVDGPVADEDKSAPRHGAKWALLGESFEFPLIPVQAGTAIDIKNEGRKKVELYSPDAPEVVDPEPLSPGLVRAVRLEQPLKAIRILEKNSAHLEGIVAAFPHPYFSRVDAKGEYQIDGVPPGKWTVRVWYRTGWLSETTKVDVAAKRATRADTLTLPKVLEPKAASSKATGEDKGA